MRELLDDLYTVYGWENLILKQGALFGIKFAA